MPDQQTQPQDVALSEAKFLKREADRAQLAMRRALNDTGANLLHGVDPRGWAKDHPWASLAAATVAGFATAAAVVPSEEQRAVKKLKAIDRALRARLRDAEKTFDEKFGADGNGTSDKKPAKRGSFLTLAAAEALKLARPILMSTLSSFMKRGSAGTDATDGSASADSTTSAEYPSPT